MTFTTPPTATNGSAIASGHVNTLADNDNWFNALLQSPSAAGQVPISTSTNAAVYQFVGSATITDGHIGTAQLADQAIGPANVSPGHIDTTILAADVVAKLPPSGLGGWFRTAAQIAAGWARESSVDGRMMVGAGTTFSVTYVEETNYGTSWFHAHTISTAGAAVVAASPATQDTTFIGAPDATAGHTNHGHDLSTSTSLVRWEIPLTAYVAARKS